jgi:hypothetical protein
VAVVVHRVVLVAGKVEHRMVPVGGTVASVAVVARREVFAVDTGNFVTEVVLHTGWVVVTAPQAPFRSWYKIVDQR